MAQQLDSATFVVGYDERVALAERKRPRKRPTGASFERPSRDVLLLSARQQGFPLKAVAAAAAVAEERAIRERENNNDKRASRWETATTTTTARKTWEAAGALTSGNIVATCFHLPPSVSR